MGVAPGVAPCSHEVIVSADAWHRPKSTERLAPFIACNNIGFHIKLGFESRWCTSGRSYARRDWLVSKSCRRKTAMLPSWPRWRQEVFEERCRASAERRTPASEDTEVARQKWLTNLYPFVLEYMRPLPLLIPRGLSTTTCAALMGTHTRSSVILSPSYRIRLFYGWQID